MPRLIMNKFFNNKKANSSNKKQINNSLNNNERNKYGFPSYNYIKKLHRKGATGRRKNYEIYSWLKKNGHF